MSRVFTALAVLWAIALGFDLRFAPHDVAAHWFMALWVTAVFVGLPIAWHWLEQYKYTASIAGRIDAADGKIWKRVALHLEGAKTALVLVLTSAFATVKDWFGTTIHTLLGLAPSDLDVFKDSTLLHTFFNDAVALKAIAGVTLFAAFLSIRSKLTAAKIVPAPAPAAAPAAPGA